MHLAKLTLDPDDPQARRDIADAYEMHRTLCRAFAFETTEAPKRFLWRLEPDRSYTARGLATVLIQSAQQGNWQPITDLPGYRLEGEKHVDLAGLLQIGRQYQFRLAANATVTRGGKRFGLVGEEALRTWLERQAGRCGFVLQETTVGSLSRLSVRQPKSGHRITVDVTRFDGVLEAREPDTLKRALTEGIGHAKALGLGMLSLAPAQMARLSAC